MYILTIHVQCLCCFHACVHSLLFSVCVSEYPKEFNMYGLTEEILTATFHQVQSGEKSLQWHLTCIPTISFYRSLHCYFKKWPVSSRLSKISLGKFYIAIDANLKLKGSRPDNVYKFIDKLSQSQSDDMMNYGRMQECIRKQELRDMRHEIDICNQKLKM